MLFACAQVIRTLEEPTAAALAFGLHRKPNVNHILVYDLGGGTLDVSVLFVNDGSVEVLGSDGDDNLGGKFHKTIIEIFFVSSYVYHLLVQLTAVFVTRKSREVSVAGRTGDNIFVTNTLHRQ